MLASSVIKFNDEETVDIYHDIINTGIRFSGISSPLSLNIYNPFISLIINNWCLLFKYLLSFCFHILSSFHLF